MLGDKVWMKVDRSGRRLLSYYENKRVEWHCAVLCEGMGGAKELGNLEITALRSSIGV